MPTSERAGEPELSYTGRVSAWSVVIGLSAMLAGGCTAPASSTVVETPPSSPPPLALDDHFAPVFVNAIGGAVTASAFLDDGRLLVGGNFSYVDDQSCSYLACLEADGSIDDEFAANGAPDGMVRTIRVLDNGRVLVAGEFKHFGDVRACGIVRLLPNGELDPEFHPPETADQPALTTAAAPDGRVYLGGLFDEIGGERVPHLVRLLPDGSLDASFQAANPDQPRRPAAVAYVASSSDGGAWTIVARSRTPYRDDVPAAYPTAAQRLIETDVLRLDPEGEVDAGFHFEQADRLGPRVLLPLPDGELLVGGAGGLVLLTSSGAIDGHFKFSEADTMDVFALAALGGGRFLVGGRPRGNAMLSARLLVVDRSGAVLARYLQPRDELHAFFTVAAHDGRLMAAGVVRPASPGLLFAKSANRILRLDPTLSLASSFSASVGAIASDLALAALPDGQLALAGSFLTIDGRPRRRIARLHPDGKLDHSFDPGAGLSGPPNVLISLPDGDLLVAGRFDAFDTQESRGIARIRSNGTMEPVFAENIPVHGTFLDGTVLADGSIVLVGRISGRVGDIEFSDIVRLDRTGLIDRRLAWSARSWLPGGAGQLNAVATTASGHLLVGGEFDALQGYERHALARIGGEGVVDPSFVAQTEDFASITGIAVLRDQRIFVQGWGRPPDEGATPRLFARLMPDGSRDPSFKSPEFESAEPLLAAPLTDGTTVVVLRDLSPDAMSWRRMVRLDRDGRIMSGFDVPLGNDRTDLALAAGADGSVYLAGLFRTIAGRERHGLARFAPVPE